MNLKLSNNDNHEDQDDKKEKRNRMRMAHGVMRGKASMALQSSEQAKLRKRNDALQISLDETNADVDRLRKWFTLVEGGIEEGNTWHKNAMDEVAFMLNLTRGSQIPSRMQPYDTSTTKAK